jgi:hypothetical protein
MLTGCMQLASCPNIFNFPEMEGSLVVNLTYHEIYEPTFPVPRSSQTAGGLIFMVQPPVPVHLLLYETLAFFQGAN